jgi:hypothetical protein
VVTDHHEIVRSPEQISFDLGKAMQFSQTDLQAARKGILPISSFQPLFRTVLKPILRAAGFILVPWGLAAYFASSHQNSSIFQGLAIVFSNLGHLPEFAADHGWFRTILYIKALFLPTGYGVYYLTTKVPFDLVRDMLGKRVRVAEGRVTLREEDKKVPGKRDEVSFYYFHLKERQFQVSRKAFLAIDDGGSYRAYFLPRSNTLVAIEPSTLAKEAEEKEMLSRAEHEAHGMI